MAAGDLLTVEEVRAFVGHGARALLTRGLAATARLATEAAVSGKFDLTELAAPITRRLTAIEEQSGERARNLEALLREKALAGGALLALGALWPVIAAEVKVLAHATYDTLPSTGLLLDSASWAGLPFVEGETLHFKPVAGPGVTS